MQFIKHSLHSKFTHVYNILQKDSILVLWAQQTKVNAK